MNHKQPSLSQTLSVSVDLPDVADGRSHLNARSYEVMNRGCLVFVWRWNLDSSQKRDIT